jgi:hypothetical protein
VRRQAAKALFQLTVDSIQPEWQSLTALCGGKPQKHSSN